MMKLAVLFTLTTLSTSLSAADLCTKYEYSKRYMKAIEIVAQYQNYTKEEFCNLPHVLDIEVQPTHIIKIINDKPEVIPHASVQQHKSEDSCMYLVNELDYSITKARCYSGM